MKRFDFTARVLARTARGRAGPHLAIWLALAALLAGPARAGGPTYVRSLQPLAGGLSPMPIITNTVISTQYPIGWIGFGGPYQVEHSPSLTPAVWEPFGAPTQAKTMPVTAEGDLGFFRVQGADPVFAGYSPCLDCHYEKFDAWAQTRHATALETLKQAGQQTNAICLKCHTVGYGYAGGFKDEATTPHLAGVQCENCHGPATDHVRNPADKTKRPLVELSANVCGGCHNGFHHPTLDEWNTSPHATVSERPAEDFRSTNSVARIQACGPCHSGAARVTMLKNMGLSSRRQWALPGGDYAASVGVTCAVCHDPHGSANPAELRNPVRSLTPFSYSTAATNSLAAQYNPELNLCGQCHNMRGASWQTTGRYPHYSPQYNILIGNGGVETDVLPLQSEHRDTPKQCAGCHVHGHAPANPSQTDPVYKGHDFKVNYDVCLTCHDQEAVTALLGNGIRQYVDRQTTNLVAQLGTWAATKAPPALRTKYGALTWEYTVPGPLSDQTKSGPTTAEQALVPAGIKQARFNLYLVHQDKSRGIHNPGYVHYLLRVAEAKIRSELAP